MKLTSQNFTDGAPIPGEFAFAVADDKNHLALSNNKNPHLAWDDVPAGTKSFVLLCHDPDAPCSTDDVNQEGRQVAASLPRVNFTHWVLIDIPADARAIAAGSHSAQITARGKPAQAPGKGMRHGINDYTSWFSGDEQMNGDYYGYDGPCPPWNDELAHRYIFTLYALDTARLNVEGKIYRDDVLAAIDGHVLAQASLIGSYSLNPAVR
ncbi:YbhB/YbcL family Raf kinase inhibitor-like protein [Affinibrenneria salicis]|uniref:YbhB/YbcL family Raf kinase inhibitor-like protein n=1 Tax=Affinibrenneria salicis TaxID=2590031 RepID=A0A5J5FT74_9GAMM|nr:YbhB/YbcL family Raf kinase inhibitor-like protein [Affinibrenneria salicis]KAA8995737.1 YbhB/YbcL family Raf kinase inhibitor-like protein [Affinibrenneria salicis]